MPRVLREYEQRKFFFKRSKGKQSYSPKKATEEAAGYDLLAGEEGTIAPGERKKINLNLSLKLPKNWAGVIKPRSGHAAKGWTVDAGVIDPDYTREISVLCVNQSKISWDVKPGERITQLLIIPISELLWEETDALPVTKRNKNGWGSTGWFENFKMIGEEVITKK